MSGTEPVPSSGLVRHAIGRGLSAMVDPFVVSSFDRTGYRIHSLRFQDRDLRVDLSGRRCLVTGANSGIGLATARSLAERGAEVTMLCRNPERGEAAATEVRRQTGNPHVAYEPLDVSDLRSVRSAAARFVGRRLDVLVHNAGVLPAERIETPDGLELTFATHVAGPFLLTSLLRADLAKSTDGRVVFVSSGGMYTRRLEVRDPNWTRRPYDGVVAYAETKRAQVVLAELWAHALRNSRVVVNSMHPGWADTPAVESSLPRFHRITRAILRSPEQGADTVLWLAASRAARNWSGRFFFDREPRRTHWLPGTRESDADREALWRLCEEAGGTIRVLTASEPDTAKKTGTA